MLMFNGYGVLSGLLVLMLSTGVNSSDLTESKKILNRVNDNAASTQAKVNNLAKETDAAVSEYRQILSKTTSVDLYNQQLQVLLTSQTEEIASLQLQLDSLESTQREIMPLMFNMLQGLATFVQLDIPFLLKERQARINELNTMMTQANITTAEKYRRILEAFMIEVDYGHTIEAYEQHLDINQHSLSVELLRVGRVALLYKTRDDQTIGFWNNAEKQWQHLPKDFLPFIRKGLKIARKQSAPDLLTIPILKVDAQS